MSQIHVFDTFATSQSGTIMHFDVVTPEKNAETALLYAREWLNSVGEGNAQLTPENCAYCHSEASAPPPMQEEIACKGYAIYKLEGCPR